LQVNLICLGPTGGRTSPQILGQSEHSTTAKNKAAIKNKTTTILVQLIVGFSSLFFVGVANVADKQDGIYDGIRLIISLK